MKKIIYTRNDGGLSVVHPAEGARLAFAIKAVDGTDVMRSPNAVPVDSLMRRWPVDGVTAEWAETEDEFIARVLGKSVPHEAVNVAVVEESVLPADRTFRDAWKHDGGGVVGHDMEKCRNIHKDRLRELRKPKLAALDVAYSRADENGDAVRKREIAAQKQSLRDVTNAPEIQAAKTIEELKGAVPSVLL